MRIGLLIPVIFFIAGWAFSARASATHASAISGHLDGIQISTTDTLIRASGGEIFGTTLLIENNSDKQFVGNLVFALPQGVILLSAQPEGGIQLDAHSKRYIPIRFQVNADAPADSAGLRINLANQDQQTLSGVLIQVRVQEKRLIRLQALNNMELIRHENDSINATLILRNTGNTDEMIQLVSSVPTFYGSRRFLRELLYLEAGTDTTVKLGIIADRELFHMNQFQINITGLYDDHEVFGNTSISVQNASSTRNFDLTSNYGFNWYQRTNRIILTSRNPMSDNQSMSLDANLQFNTAQGHLELNSQLYQWGDVSNVPILTNTYLHYSQNNLGITLGNITETSEKFINGRGAKLAFLDSASNYYFSAGAADKSYDLLNRYGRMGSGTGFSVFSTFQAGGFLPEKGKRYTGSVIFDRDPIENVESFLHSSSIPILSSRRNRRTNLEVVMGVGVSRPLVDTLQVFQTQPSLSVGANFNTDFRRIHFSSSNYYGSGYYPGHRRGTLNLNQRAGIRFGASNVWLGYQYLDFNPRTFISQYNATQLTTERIEMSVSWGLSPFASLSLVPSGNREQSYYPYIFNSNIKQNWEIYSYRLEGLLNMRSRNNRHAINLSLEGGYREEITEGGAALYRGNLSYNFKRLSLNFNYQQGGFSVFELINNAESRQETIYRMGGALNFNYLENRFFRSYLGIQYFKDSFSGDNLGANARTEVSLGSKSAVFGQANLYRYKNLHLESAYNMANFQVGITQSLARNNAKNGTKRGNLEVFVFYDHNLNGVFDEGDEKANEKSILINDVLFLTDASGIVTYKMVPFGQYSIRAPMEKGWFAPEVSFNMAHKSEKMQIALQRSGTLRGTILINYDPRLNLEANTNLEGYTITAVNQAGYVTKTRSDSNGSFLLFLPEGKYTIYLNEQEFPPNIYTELREQSMSLEPGKINELPPFELKVRERKIEVRRFGSTQ